MPSYRTIQVFKNKNQNIIVPSSTSQMYGRIVLWVTVDLKRDKDSSNFTLFCVNTMV